MEISDELPPVAVVLLPNVSAAQGLSGSLWCCSELPTGNSLLVSNLILLRKTLGVHQVWIVASEDTVALVREHLERSQKALKSLKPTVVGMNTDHTAEILRELESGGHVQLSRSDFLVITGDAIISAVDAVATMEAHRAAKQTSRLLTRLFMPSTLATPGLQRWMSWQGNLVLLNSKTHTLLDIQDRTAKTSYEIPSKYLETNEKLQLFGNVAAAGLDVCSGTLMAYLYDEFDCQHFYPDLIERVLGDELNLHSIGAVISNTAELSGRVPSQPTLLAMLKWLLTAFSSPSSYLHLIGSSEALDLFRPNEAVAQCSNHEVTYGTEPVRTGRGTQLPACNCKLECSVIGKNCILGDHTSVISSLISDNVRLGSNVKCVNCVIESGVVVEDHVCLENAHVTRGATLLNSVLFSDSSKIWKIRFCTETERLGDYMPQMTVKEFLEGAAKEEDDDDDVHDNASSNKQASEKSLNGVNAAEGRDAQKGENAGFEEEIYALCCEGFLDPSNMNHKLLEVQSYRLSCNQTFTKCIPPAVRAFVAVSAQKANGMLTRDIVKKLEPALLLQTLVPYENRQAQLILLTALLDATATEVVQTYAVTEGVERPNPFFAPVSFCILLQELANLEILDDVLLPEWRAERLRSSLPPGSLSKLTSDPMQQYINWLQQSSEDEDAASDDNTSTES